MGRYGIYTFFIRLYNLMKLKLYICIFDQNASRIFDELCYFFNNNSCRFPITFIFLFLVAKSDDSSFLA